MPKKSGNSIVNCSFEFPGPEYDKNPEKKTDFTVHAQIIVAPAMESTQGKL